MKNRTLAQSFKTAFHGFYDAFRSERNLKVHIAVAVLVVLIGLVLQIDALRWLAVFGAMGLVFICELLNTAVEKLTDMVTAEYSERARAVK
ncbi:MAG: diacylglycerol kinase family protein, partial [Clostridia bacterium]|nr:diacylglycerol kinase family protein [Clostridia bacterium]